jgi:hypothetical protein
MEIAGFYPRGVIVSGENAGCVVLIFEKKAAVRIAKKSFILLKTITEFSPLRESVKEWKVIKEWSQPQTLGYQELNYGNLKPEIFRVHAGEVSITFNDGKKSLLRLDGNGMSEIKSLLF